MTPRAQQYRNQIKRMLKLMNWQDACEIGLELFVPILKEHPEWRRNEPPQTDLAVKAETVLKTMYENAVNGDPQAARVFLLEASKLRSFDEAGDVIINIVPYDVPDKLKVEIEGYAGDNDTGIGDAEDVLISNP